MIQEMICAVILTHNRQELVKERIKQLAPQVDTIIVYDNMSDPWFATEPQSGLGLIRDTLQPPNIMHSWNKAWNEIFRCVGGLVIDKWWIPTICDDVDIPDGWVQSIITAMKETGAVAGSTHSITPVSEPIVKTSPDGDIFNRMNGAAFILAGHSNIRADERMHWWFGDTDIDWQARISGGMVIAPGPVATNTQPNHYTNVKPELAEQAGRDRVVFGEKWGFVPW